MAASAIALVRARLVNLSERNIGKSPLLAFSARFVVVAHCRRDPPWPRRGKQMIVETNPSRRGCEPEALAELRLHLMHLFTMSCIVCKLDHEFDDRPRISRRPTGRRRIGPRTGVPVDASALPRRLAGTPLGPCAGRYGHAQNYPTTDCQMFLRLQSGISPVLGCSPPAAAFMPQPCARVRTTAGAVLRLALAAGNPGRPARCPGAGRPGGASRARAGGRHRAACAACRRASSRRRRCARRSRPPP